VQVIRLKKRFNLIKIFIKTDKISNSLKYFIYIKSLQTVICGINEQSECQSAKIVDPITHVCYNDQCNKICITE
jgi:hypothetical protein